LDEGWTTSKLKHEVDAELGLEKRSKPKPENGKKALKIEYPDCGDTFTLVHESRHRLHW
jgi:hypothetical protein